MSITEYRQKDYLPVIHRLIPLLVALSLLAAPSRASDLGLSARPPWHRDSVSVENGCFISATCYLLRLRQSHPDLRAETATVVLPGGGKHTVVVITSNNLRYCRDPQLGVFPLQDGEVGAAYLKALQQWCRDKRMKVGSPRAPVLTEAERNENIRLAQGLLRSLHPRILEVTVDGRTRQVLSWRTEAGTEAVYEPTQGTAVGAPGVGAEELAALLLGPARPSIVAATAE